MPIIHPRMSGASLDEIEQVYERVVEFKCVAAAVVRDRELARDVVQDAFATIVRERGGFGRRGSLEAWVWRAVVNTPSTTGRPRDVTRPSSSWSSRP
jgi:DNA-directed RNA polymerase specialized sigma24 family protein